MVSNLNTVVRDKLKRYIGLYDDDNPYLKEIMTFLTFQEDYFCNILLLRY
jgi:hypothetical protein